MRLDREYRRSEHPPTAPPEIISRRNNRIIQRPFRLLFVLTVVGAGSIGWRGGNSMLSMGGIGAPGAVAFRVKEGVQEVPVRVLPELGIMRPNR